MTYFLAKILIQTRIVNLVKLEIQSDQDSGGNGSFENKEQIINILEDMDMEGLQDICEIKHYDQNCTQAPKIIDNILRIDIRK